MTKNTRILVLVAALTLAAAEEPRNFFDCLREKSILACTSRLISNQIQRTETDVPGRQSDVSVTKVFEETSYLIAEALQTVFGKSSEDEAEGERGMGGKKNKLHLHRKKKLRKLFLLGMILKSKIGLLFQLLSAHFQMKFFVVAVLGLIINAARFWLDLKKAFYPSKVVYYEHAQHQHHYDHEDDHGYWGRSFDKNAGHKLAYAGHLPKN